jgi:hypothetical protein
MTKFREEDAFSESSGRNCDRTAQDGNGKDRLTLLVLSTGFARLVCVDRKKIRLTVFTYAQPHLKKIHPKRLNNETAT